MVQVPAAIIETVLPATEQTDAVNEENVTGRLEEAVAVRVNGGAP